MFNIPTIYQIRDAFRWAAMLKFYMLLYLGPPVFCHERYVS